MGGLCKGISQGIQSSGALVFLFFENEFDVVRDKFVDNWYSDEWLEKFKEAWEDVDDDEFSLDHLFD